MRRTAGSVRTLIPIAAGLTALLAGLAAGPPAAGVSAGSTTEGTRASTGCDVDPAAPKRQLRADWIASVTNIDWPSRPGLTAEQQKAELIGWYDEAVDRGLNAVVVQVRPTADAFWPSDVEPWSKYLTGTQGQDPGYDPLAFAVREAHARNLEFHAWFNPYRVSMDTNRDALIPSHPASVHPDWVVAYGGKLYYNPGIPAARTLVEDAIMDAVEKYDIDAVHFDDYFYPYPVAGQAFPDDDTFAQYPDGYTDKADWRRHNINLLITELGDRIHAIKPWVKFGVSPFAVWRNKATDPQGSDTTAGAQTYDDLYADTRRWVREEWIDYIAPQVYWNIGFAPADYAMLVPWWSQQVRGTDVQLYIGQATYKVETSTQDPAWQDKNEMTRHLSFNRFFPEVKGDIYFSAKDVRANRLGHMDIVQADHYQHPALIPETAGVPGKAPRAPERLRAAAGAGGVDLTWNAGSTSSVQYAVYRFDGSGVRPSACDLADATHLVGTLRGGQGSAAQRWTDPTAAPGSAYTYVVTALDRAYRESGTSNRASIR
jgi:uncharacterized lipoprotein YddW (UPF0748 family)